MFARLLIEGMLASSIYSLALTVVLFSMDASAALFRTPRAQGKPLYYMNVLVVLAVSGSRYLIDKYDESDQEASVGISTAPQPQQHVELTDENLGVQLLHVKAQAIREAMFSPAGSARSAEMLELAQSCVEGDRLPCIEPDPAPTAQKPEPPSPQPISKPSFIPPPPPSKMQSPSNLPPIMRQEDLFSDALSSDVWNEEENPFEKLDESGTEIEQEEERSTYVSEQVLSTLKWNTNQPTAV